MLVDAIAHAQFCHFVERGEQFFVHVDRYVAAVELYVSVVLGVVDVDVERHLAVGALERCLQVGELCVVEHRGFHVYRELLYRLLLHVAEEFNLLYHHVVGVGVVAEALHALRCDVDVILLLQHALPFCPFLAEECQLALALEVFDGDDAERFVGLGPALRDGGDDAAEGEFFD